MWHTHSKPRVPVVEKQFRYVCLLPRYWNIRLFKIVCFVIHMCMNLYPCGLMMSLHSETSQTATMVYHKNIILLESVVIRNTLIYSHIQILVFRFWCSNVVNTLGWELDNNVIQLLRRIHKLLTCNEATDPLKHSTFSNC